MRIPELFRRTWVQAALLVLFGGVMLVGCFRADFLTYDDSEHIDTVEYRDATSVFDYFMPRQGASFLPVTLLSYRVDKALHSWWSMPAFGSWAPGVRLDNWLLHGAAAVVLWRLLLALGLTPGASFFIALIFAVHPLACESVCWVSERKNIFAALFGLGALWAQIGLRGRGEARRWAVVLALYALALMSKPSALGLLPIIWALELIPARIIGIKEGAPATSRPNWAFSVAALIALSALAYADIKLNTSWQSGDLVLPPGGTAFTALLTDLDIFSRYALHIVWPFGLSAVYAVEPIRNLSDARVWLYGAFFLGAFGTSMAVARHRGRCLFGWFWFFAALGPNCNVIAIPFLMQDRYEYLATPGLLLVVIETFDGLTTRVFGAVQRERVAAIAGTLAVAVCLVVSAQRGYLWRSTQPLFEDAVARQPHAFYAHYGLGGAWYQTYRNAPRLAEQRGAEPMFEKQFREALGCSDRERFSLSQDAALILGEHAFSRAANPEQVAAARTYFEIGARRPAEISGKDETMGLCLAYLSVIDLFQKRIDDAWSHAREALRLAPCDQTRLAFGRAALAYAAAHPEQRDALIPKALVELLTIKQDSALWSEVHKALKELEKK